ncbi:MAG: ATP-binding protein [Candidatus Binatia bacterium]
MSLENSSASWMPLEAVITTSELQRRESRAPAYEAEIQALSSLMKEMASSSGDVLQKLVEAAIALTGAHSAGVSLLEGAGGSFRWHAVAGQWSHFLGATMPRALSPCGTVLDRNAALLMAQPQKHFPFPPEVAPAIVEALLVPFHVDGEPIGTVWVIAHDENRKFDLEDLRLVTSLGTFAASVYQLRTERIKREELQEQERQTSDQLRNLAAALSEADRHKNEFLATLAHELRNPLAPILNALQILRLPTANGGLMPSALAMMERQVGQIVRFVEDLVDISRVSRGTVELRRGSIELASSVHHAVEANRPLCESMGHHLIVSVPDGPIVLDADPSRLAQVVGNLLNNACKFTPRGGSIWLTVTERNSEAVIRVRDTGRGIAADDLPHVFRIFMQADTSLERSTSGLGIGLSLVETLVHLHGGSVSVESGGRGEGAEFTVRLPISPDLPEPVSDQPLGSAQDFPSGHRILVIDDNHDAAESLSLLLESSGNELRTAFDGLEGLLAAETFKPDAILLDIGLPKMNGYEVARRIRKEPWGKDILLIALTGWGQKEDREQSRSAGFNNHLIKPVDLGALTRILATL